jgi:D-alanyl-D-alanine carboxypeptidase/D-alanyl-D-alanine-endopeptidase (penicillin-binding protein 4)
VSGVLNTADGPRYISMVSNGASAPNDTIGGLLRQARVPGLCPAF